MIDVGPGTGDYAATYSSRTFVDAGNPANATGTIDYVETFFSGTGTGFGLVCCKPRPTRRRLR